jgi:hypothetical protein
MFVFPDTEQKLRRKISGFKSALAREKNTHDFIRDGSGKRYLLFSMYFVLNEQDKSKEYLDWYSSEFPDDAGEPVQMLCWSLILYRMGQENQARKKLAETMMANLYLIPDVLGECVQEYDMWHSSNFAEIDYVEELPREVRSKITEADIQWLKNLYESFEFCRIRKRFIEIFHSLKHERAFEVRRRLLVESHGLLNILSAR